MDADLYAASRESFIDAADIAVRAAVWKQLDASAAMAQAYLTH